MTITPITTCMESRKKFHETGLRDMCIHVEEDYTKMEWLHSNYGEESTLLCNECSDKVVSREDKYEEECVDCGGLTSIATGGILFKYWYHCESQGDEPIPVCSSCRRSEKHQNRLTRDRLDEERYFSDTYNED